LALPVGGGLPEIGVETVLSSPKYRALVDRALQRGFRVRFSDIVLKSAELQTERIRIRVSEGGHDVPAEKISSRRKRSFEQLAWFMQKADACYIYDNSTGEPEFLGGKIGDVIVRFHPLPNDLQTELDAAGIVFVDFPRS
jgi:predicted ABC-type ATPase